MRLFIANAFSLSMLNRNSKELRCPKPVDNAGEIVQALAGAGAKVVSCVGHADTAAIIGKALGREIPANRVGIRLEEGDFLLVAQVVTKDGQPYRLPEGTTVLPEDARIEWWQV